MFANKETIVCCSCLQSAWAMGKSIAPVTSHANLAIIHAARSSVITASAAACSGMDS